MEWSLAIVALTLLGVAAVSRRLSGTLVTPAMVWSARWGCWWGPEGLGEMDLEGFASGTVGTLAEGTLALVLLLWTRRASISGSFVARLGCAVACSGSGCR